ncbi:DUF411 domain-containing protein [Pseudocolwellia sp. HL-MZ19]|uniref:DUF411 domain-containing protein n=1 Tax=unclassified Pseudocolwellia TaxID=2848178 RepID=UPI003CE6988A
MFPNKYILKIIATFFIVTLIVSCSDNDVVRAESNTAKAQPISLDVYKTPTCGCCKKWISHIDENGFQSQIHDRNDISSIKEQKGIKPRYRSCHTAISKDGYTFEGHVPAKFIKQFLSQKHDKTVIGLSVPGMPLGSPGMEVGDKFNPYQVLLLKSDGSSEVYSTVQSYEQQF